MLSSEIIHRGQFNLIHHESGLKIDLMVRKETEHARSEFKRRRKLSFWQGLDAYVLQEWVETLGLSAQWEKAK